MSKQTKNKYSKDFYFEFVLDLKFSNEKTTSQFVRIIFFENNIEIKKILIYFSSKKHVSPQIIYVLRALLRDSEYVLIFIQNNGLPGLKKVSFFIRQIKSIVRFSSKWISICVISLQISAIVTTNRHLLLHRMHFSTCSVGNQIETIRIYFLFQRYSAENSFEYFESDRTR